MKPVKPTASALTRRRFVLAAAAVGLAGSLGACTLHLGHATPSTLPSPSALESARDGVARQATLIQEMAAQVVALKGDPTVTARAQAIEKVAATSLKDLGGVWQPWPSGAPSEAPTVDPAPTPTSRVDAPTLLTALSEGVTLARTACEVASGKDRSALGAIVVRWAIQARALATALGAEPPSQDTGAAREMNTALITPAALRAYDAARYALEELAARSTDTARERAIADAAVATAVVQGALAAGVKDERLPAYAAPAKADTDSSLEVTWAREAWVAVCSQEIAGLASVETLASASPTGSSDAGASPTAAASPTAEAGSVKATDTVTLALNAALDAAQRAVAWGEDPSEILA